MTRSGISISRWLVGAIARCLVFSSTALASEEFIEATQWRTIQQREILFFLPEAWKVETDVLDSGFEGISPVTSKDDPFQERIEVDVVEDRDGRSLTEFATEEIVGLASRLSNLTIITSGPVEHGEHIGLGVEASYTSSWGEMFVEIFFLKTEGRFYEFTVKGQAQDLDRFRPIFDKMLASMRPIPAIFDQVYVNQKFLIQFPSNWEIREGLPGTVVAGVSPRNGRDDEFRERVTVAYERLREGMTFEIYASKMFGVLLERLPGSQEISRRNVMFGNTKGLALELSHKIQRIRTTLEVLIVPDGRQVFVFNCAGRDPDYTSFKPIFSRILNSFASTTPPPTLFEDP
ncbi:MAG: hypothetical protein AAGJ81_08700 [Verrucomicrobiota bacterium]